MTGEDARRETFGRSVQLRPSAHLKRSLIFKEMIVILSCHGYGGLSFVARRKRKIMPLENGSFFRVSRCNFNKSWISGRARGMRGWKREIVAGGTACEFGIPRAHRCLGLIYRRAVIYTYDLRIFSLSLPPPFFFRFENETINEWKSILFHLIRAPDKNQVIKKRNFPNSILKEIISPRAPSCIPYAQIRFPKQLFCRSQSLFRGILSPLKFIFNHFSAHVAGNQITG